MSNIRKVFINAGHSKDVPGAVIPGRLTESELAMVIRDSVKLQAKNLGLELVFVPDDLNLIDSINWVNERASKYDVAISIHINANENVKVNGLETYYSNNSELAEIFSNSISRSINLINRGVRHDSETFIGRLGWLRNLNCPSVLLECGYLTGDIDYGLITVPSNTVKLANGIIDGIIEYDIRQGMKVDMFKTLDNFGKFITEQKVKLIRKKYKV